MRQECAHLAIEPPATAEQSRNHVGTACNYQANPKFMSRGSEAREPFRDHELKQSPRDRGGIPEEAHLSATAKEFMEHLKS